jgi:ParB family chromosome partitioning protein
VNEILRITGCGNQVRRDRRRIAVDEVDRAGRHAGVGERADQLGRRARRLLGRLDDDRAAGGERRRELAHDLVDREVPRRERGDRADRLLDDELIDPFAARRDDAAVGAARFLGEPVDRVGAVEDLALRLGEGLALLLRHDLGDRLQPLAQQVGGLAHHLRALVRRHLAPGPEAFRRRLERAVEVGAVGERERADRLAGGGVDDRMRTAGSGRRPGAVDVELDVGVHADLSR